MKAVKKKEARTEHSLVRMANCSCGNCTCRYCNVYIANPHETEVGSNAMSAMIGAGYYG